MFLFQDGGLCNPGWPQTLSNSVNLPGAGIKDVSYHSQFRHFYVLDTSQWGKKKQRFLALWNFYCGVWKRQWIMKIIDPKCQRVVRAKREGKQ